MESESIYTVEITPEAEIYFYQLLRYLEETHSRESADKKFKEILAIAQSLESFPERGAIEGNLASLGMKHRFLVYEITARKTIKIIYFIRNKVVYITDFFPTEKDSKKITLRNK